MQRKFQIGVRVVGMLGAGILSCSVAMAQDAAPPSLKEQLEAQYNLATVNLDSPQTPISAPGTVLVLQKDGILGVPLGNAKVCTSRYQDAKVQAPSDTCGNGKKANALHTLARLSAAAYAVSKVTESKAHPLKTGDKVYPTKIDVDLEGSKIAFGIIECDSCNGVSQPSSLKSEVVFQFADGYLKTAGVPEVEDTIGQVFAIDNSSAQQDSSQPAAQAGDQPAQAGGQADQQPQQQTKTIQLGMTPDQVETALGQPDKKVDLGAKKIYVYKDLKVTFADGKVSDVQ